MYSDIEKMYIWLDSFDFPIKKNEEILSRVQNMENLFEYVRDNGEYLTMLLGESVYNKMLVSANVRFLEQMLDRLENLKVFCITIESKDYPERLYNIDGKPIVLYTKGNYKILKDKSLAIVGTRRPTRYGRETTEYFANKLAGAGLVLVSGLAFGIDTCVAQTCVDLGVPTVAVLAGGLDSIYPSQNSHLAEQIINCGGVLISEHAPYSKTSPHYFLDRNRIISGLSLGTLVVEAGVKSGAKTTAYDAVEQGRELFVIPGNIDSYASAGCNELIHSMPEAFCISPKHILETLKIDATLKKDERVAMQFSMTQKMILDCLSYDEISIDDIQEQTGLDGKTLLTELATLEISGIIKKVAGNYYAKINLPNSF